MPPRAEKENFRESSNAVSTLLENLDLGEMGSLESSTIRNAEIFFRNLGVNQKWDLLQKDNKNNSMTLGWILCQILSCFQEQRRTSILQMRWDQIFWEKQSFSLLPSLKSWIFCVEISVQSQNYSTVWVGGGLIYIHTHKSMYLHLCNMHTSQPGVDSYQGNHSLTVTFPKAISNWKKYKARLVSLISFGVVRFRFENQRPFIFRVISWWG